MTKQLRVYGLSEDALRHRLAEMCVDPSVGVTLSVCGGHGTVTLTAPEERMEEWAAEASLCLSGYVYSEEDETLAAVVVRLLTAHGLTVSTAESCTGGLIAAALTDVPGASRVFGTGVVSYSNTCKEALLAVSSDTLAATGAVSAATAGQMARGVRAAADASIGVAVTGEAGPIPAEDHPVGTVFIALADAKRTWVEELHLDGVDRAAIRGQAADSVLWLLWRYLSAYPAVMAGGETHRAIQKREIPRTQGAGQPRLLSRILPWRGDSRPVFWIKWAAWLCAVAVLAVSLWAGYTYLLEPDRNRELQDSLGDLYYESNDLTDGAADTTYPEGMMAVFRGLYDMNGDIGGWIHIPDSGVDYPVMNYTDGYYRNHNFDKEYSIYGQPYLDHHFSLEHPQMLVVHGRNTGDGQMFSDLLHYRRVAYLREHPVIEMNTLYGNAHWQIFAVFVLDSRDTDHFNLQEEPKDYGDFLDSVLVRSLFLSDLTVTEEDSLLLLTANAQREYGFNGAQLVVAARRLEGEAQKTTYRVNNRAKMPAAMSGGRTTTRTTRSTTTTATTTTATSTTTGTETTVTTEDTTVTQSSTEAGGDITTVTDTDSTTSTEAGETTTTDAGDVDHDETDGENYDHIGN